MGFGGMDSAFGGGAFFFLLRMGGCSSRSEGARWLFCCHQLGLELNSGVGNDAEIQSPEKTRCPQSSILWVR